MKNKFCDHIHEKVNKAYTLSQKNVPSWLAIGLTYIHQFLQFLDMSSAEIQKLAAGKTFSNTSLLLTL